MEDAPRPAGTTPPALHDDRITAAWPPGSMTRSASRDGASGRKRIMATTQIIAEPAVPRVVVTREFAAPRELLFRAYTDPGLLVQWLGPRALNLAVDRFDLRHGGSWRYIRSDVDG